MYKIYSEKKNKSLCTNAHKNCVHVLDERDNRANFDTFGELLSISITLLNECAFFRF